MAGAKINSMILQNGQYYRLFTPMFLHAGFLHLAVNSFSLYNVGPAVEAYFGHKRTASIYIIAGIAGNLASFLLSPQSRAVGASGAIFGLVGALGVFFGRHQDILDTKGPLNSVLQCAAINLAFGLIPGSRIDQWGHIGGALGGALVAYLIGPRLEQRRAPARLGGYMYYIDRPLIPIFGNEKERG
ncbi:hypothetical protein T484DRAFT_3343379 [Baffinella frigidus]|nr:hypothetical protein T484DRAFT_3343379 [Cryptophyta sp. CCMP2293]